LERLIDERFRLGVEGGGCFVQDQDVGVLEQCTRNGDSLLLTA
jgi:hypothetical protein